MLQEFIYHQQHNLLEEERKKHLEQWKEKVEENTNKWTYVVYNINDKESRIYHLYKTSQDSGGKHRPKNGFPDFRG